MRTLWRIFSGLFKWTWRLLNFTREFILNLFLIVLILGGGRHLFAVQKCTSSNTSGRAAR